jgi:transcriptional regulator with XRE-family HTH domain
LSTAHADLGAALRKARLEASLSTREVGFSSGHVSQVERGLVVPSQQFLDRYVELGVDRNTAEGLLARVAQEARRRRHSDLQHAGVRTAAPTAQIDGGTDPEDIRRHYDVRESTASFIYTADRRLNATEASLLLESRADAVFFYYTGFTVLYENRQPEPPGIEVVQGGTLERTNRSPLGKTDVFIRLDSPLDRGESSRLTYRIHLDSDTLDTPYTMYVARPGNLRHDVEVHFHQDATPADIWWYAGPDPQAPSTPRPTRRLTRNGSTRYTHSFRDLVGGWCYGMTWSWR